MNYQRYNAIHTERIKRIKITTKLITFDPGLVHILLPASEFGLVRGKLDCNTEDERPVASRLESLEDMVKTVVEKLAKIESNQTRVVKET